MIQLYVCVQLYTLYEGSVVNNRTQVGLLHTSTHIYIHSKIIQKFPRTEIAARYGMGKRRPIIGSGKLHARKTGKNTEFDFAQKGQFF